MGLNEDTGLDRNDRILNITGLGATLVLETTVLRTTLVATTLSSREIGSIGGNVRKGLGWFTELLYGSIFPDLIVRKHMSVCTDFI